MCHLRDTVDIGLLLHYQRKVVPVVIFIKVIILRFGVRFAMLLWDYSKRNF